MIVSFLSCGFQQPAIYLRLYGTFMWMTNTKNQEARIKACMLSCIWTWYVFQPCLISSSVVPSRLAEFHAVILLSHLFYGISLINSLPRSSFLYPHYYFLRTPTLPSTMRPLEFILWVLWSTSDLDCFDENCSWHRIGHACCAGPFKGDWNEW